MRAFYATPLYPFAPAVGASFGNFTTRQDVSPLPLSIMYPSQIDAGVSLKIEAEGEFSTTGTPTLVLGLYCGAPGASGGGTITTVFAESSAITTGTNAAAWPWRLEYRGKITLTGSSGTITGSGNLELGTSLTAFATSVPIPITAALRTVTLNTTVANAIGVCATWGTANASNTLKTYQITSLLLN